MECKLTPTHGAFLSPFVAASSGSKPRQLRTTPCRDLQTETSQAADGQALPGPGIPHSAIPEGRHRRTLHPEPRPTAVACTQAFKAERRASIKSRLGFPNAAG